MGYTGKWLNVDLSKETFDVFETDRNLTEKYIGGKGLGFAILDKIAPNPEPLGPENPLIFVNGPFTGTKVQTSARTTLVTKSPLTNSIHDSHCGGNFGPRIKAAGFDYIVINGKADKPVYLYITDQKREILDAGPIWGKGIFETNDILIEKHKGTNPRVAAIGPAGENLSKIACIGVDKHRNYGRGGVGAVMGSKNLKAIVVDGNVPVMYSDDIKFQEVNKKMTLEILNNPGVKFRRQKGTMKCIRSGQQNEMLPVRNFKEVTTPEFEKISSETTRKELNWKDTGCFNCSIRCSKWARWDNHEIEGPEYETTAFFGTDCEIYDIKHIALANEICNDLGMDTISAGSTLAFAMECYEKNLLPANNNSELKWGNKEAQLELLKNMAYRKGLGEIFADGTKEASLKIGNNSSDFAINIYGMEISGINVKGAMTFGIAMAVADFASHTRLWIAEQEMGDSFTKEDIPETVIEGIDTVNVRNSMVICDFVPLGLSQLAELMNPIIGTNYDEKAFLEVGARIANLARRYNLRNGRKHSDDTLPERFFKEDSLAGFMRGKKIDRKEFSDLIQRIYSIRGWDSEGKPEGKTLEKFKII